MEGSGRSTIREPGVPGTIAIAFINVFPSIDLAFFDMQRQVELFAVIPVVRANGLPLAARSR